MSTTTNLGLTRLEAGLRQPEVVINDNYDLLDGIIGTAAWASYTPTWTNLSVGNGTVVAKYVKVNKTVIARLSLVFGSTTSVSGDVIFTLPVTRAAFAGSAGLMPIGQGGALDASVPAAFSAVICTPSTTTANFRFMNSSATYVTRDGATASVPFTWTTSDELAAQIVYEAA